MSRYLQRRSNLTCRFFLISLAIETSLLALPVHAQSFECAFLQEKHAEGKSNKATCSMLPEHAFSTSRYTPKKSEHCNVDKVYSYDDLEDVLIDTELGVVTWTESYGLTEDAKPRQKKYYIKRGDSEEEAEKKVNRSSRKLEQVFRIVSHHISKQSISIDDVTGKYLDPPKYVPEHNLVFTDKRSNMFYLYIPESSGHAILLQPTGDAETSWINIRFGKCRLKP